MSSALFTPIRLRGLTLANRIIVSPMCQYSARNGCATDWHLMHVGQFAVSGSGLMLMEMTDVEARGRITPHCLGLYDDACENALAPVLEFTQRYGNTPVGIQLAHAGRKASTLPPWQERRALRPDEGGWQPVAPSAIAGDSGVVPRALSIGEIEDLVAAFARAAQRAQRIGLAAIELHAAHGYLLHQFLSPLSNQRDDKYGGSLDNRMRLTLEVFDAVRRELPDTTPLGVRISATDWLDGGWNVDDSITLVRALQVRGCDWIDVSSGGLVPATIPTKPGYQVPFSDTIRRATGMTTMTVGLITTPQQAEDIVAEGKADMVALARGMLYDPRWTWHAAQALGAETAYPNQYLRCKPVA